MADERELTDTTTSDMSRRDFVALSVTGLAATATVGAAGHDVTETDVTIQTPDGTCDCAFIYPSTGTHPAVIIWPDAFGLRVSMREMAKRLAADGYSVLVPNPFYRMAKSPVFGDISKFSFANPTDRGKLTPLMGSITANDAAEKDAVALIAWLDKQKQVDTSKKIGTQGYCMGGPLVMRTAAAVPNRVGAVASFHGGGLATTAPNSPHLLAPKMKARLYVGIASNDDKSQPDAKNTLNEAFKKAGLRAKIEVYNSLHGWCVPDMPADPAAPIYNKPEAEKAWTELTALYKAALG
ncbi:MAG: dienelactone hydrolase family protein [Vicinamibacterales bacterium]